MTDTIKIAVDPDLEDLIPGFLANRHKDVDKLRPQAAGSAAVVVMTALDDVRDGRETLREFLRDEPFDVAALATRPGA